MPQIPGLFINPADAAWALANENRGIIPIRIPYSGYPEPEAASDPFLIGGSPPDKSADWALGAERLSDQAPTQQNYEELWSQEVFRDPEEYRKYYEESLDDARIAKYSLERVFGRTGERLPFGGGFKSAAEALGVYHAFKDQEKGIYTKQGADHISQFYAETERQKALSTIEYGTEIAMEIPSYWIEFSATAGGYTALRRGVLAYLKNKTRRHLARKGMMNLAGRALIEAPAAGLGLARFTAQNPWMVAEMTARTNLQLYLEGDKEGSFEKALVLGPARAAMELGTELSGGVVFRALAKLPGISDLKKMVGRAWLKKNPGSRLADFAAHKNRRGWDGVFREFEEEEWNRFGDHLMGLSEDYSVLAQLIVGTPEEKARAWRQGTAEMFAFSVMGVGSYTLSALYELPDVPTGRQKIDDFIEDPSRGKLRELPKLLREHLPKNGEEVDLKGDGVMVELDLSKKEHRAHLGERVSTFRDNVDAQADGLSGVELSEVRSEAQELIELLTENPQASSKHLRARIRELTHYIDDPATLVKRGYDISVLRWMVDAVNNRIGQLEREASGEAETDEEMRTRLRRDIADRRKEEREEAPTETAVPETETAIAEERGEAPVAEDVDLEAAIGQEVEWADKRTGRRRTGTLVDVGEKVVTINEGGVELMGSRVGVTPVAPAAEEVSWQDRLKEAEVHRKRERAGADRNTDEGVAIMEEIRVEREKMASEALSDISTEELIAEVKKSPDQEERWINEKPLELVFGNHAPDHVARELARRGITTKADIEKPPAAEKAEGRRTRAASRAKERARLKDEYGDDAEIGEDEEYVGRLFMDGLLEVDVVAEEDDHPDLPDEQKQRYMKEQLVPSVRDKDGNLLQKAAVIVGTRPKKAAEEAAAEDEAAPGVPELKTTAELKAHLESLDEDTLGSLLHGLDLMQESMKQLRIDEDDVANLSLAALLGRLIILTDNAEQKAALENALPSLHDAGLTSTRLGLFVEFRKELDAAEEPAPEAADAFDRVTDLMGRATAIRQEAEELDHEEWKKALEPAVELEKEAAELIRQELVPIVQDVLSNQLGDHGGVSFSDVFDGREWSMGETLSEHVVSTVYHVGDTMWYMLGPEVNALRDFEKRLQELASLLITTWADRSGLDAHSVMNRDISGLTKAGREKLLEHFAGVAQNIEDAVVPRLLQLTSEVKDIEAAPEAAEEARPSPVEKLGFQTQDMDSLIKEKKRQARRILKEEVDEWGVEPDQVEWSSDHAILLQLTDGSEHRIELDETWTVEQINNAIQSYDLKEIADLSFVGSEKATAEKGDKQLVHEQDWEANIWRKMPEGQYHPYGHYRGWLTDSWDSEKARLSKKYFGKSIDKVSLQELKDAVMHPTPVEGTEEHVNTGYPQSYYDEQKDDNLFTKWLNLNYERLDAPAVGPRVSEMHIPQVWQLGREKAQEWYDLWYARDMIWEELTKREPQIERMDYEVNVGISNPNVEWGYLPSDQQIALFGFLMNDGMTSKLHELRATPDVNTAVLKRVEELNQESNDFSPESMGVTLEEWVASGAWRSLYAVYRELVHIFQYPELRSRGVLDDWADNGRGAPVHVMADPGELMRNLQGWRWKGDPDSRESGVVPEVKKKDILNHSKELGGKGTKGKKAAAETLAEWKRRAKEIGENEDNSNRVIFSLFDRTGAWSQPWRDAGYTVIQVDLAEKAASDNVPAELGEGQDMAMALPTDLIETAIGNGMEVYGILAAPPCITMTSTSAKWWSRRHDIPIEEVDIEAYGGQDDPYRKGFATWVEAMWGWRAVEMFDTPHDYNIQLLNATLAFIEAAAPSGFYAIENPIGRMNDYFVGVTKDPATGRMLKGSEKQQPLMRFDPWNFGYVGTKATNLFGEFSTDLPANDVKPPASGKYPSIAHELRGSNPVERALRSVTPDGFAYAFMLANHGYNAENADELVQNLGDVLPQVQKLIHDVTGGESHGQVPEVLWWGTEDLAEGMEDTAEAELRGTMEQMAKEEAKPDKYADPAHLSRTFMGILQLEDLEPYLFGILTRDGDVISGPTTDVFGEEAIEELESRLGEALEDDKAADTAIKDRKRFLYDLLLDKLFHPGWAKEHDSVLQTEIAIHHVAAHVLYEVRRGPAGDFRGDLRVAYEAWLEQEPPESPMALMIYEYFDTFSGPDVHHEDILTNEGYGPEMGEKLGKLVHELYLVSPDSLFAGASTFSEVAAEVLGVPEREGAEPSGPELQVPDVAEALGVDAKMLEEAEAISSGTNEPVSPADSDWVDVPQEFETMPRPVQAATMALLMSRYLDRVRELDAEGLQELKYDLSIQVFARYHFGGEGALSEMSAATEVDLEVEFEHHYVHQPVAVAQNDARNKKWGKIIYIRPTRHDPESGESADFRRRIARRPKPEAPGPAMKKIMTRNEYTIALNEQKRLGKLKKSDVKEYDLGDWRNTGNEMVKLAGRESQASFLEPGFLSEEHKRWVKDSLGLDLKTFWQYIHARAETKKAEEAFEHARSIAKESPSRNQSKAKYLIPLVEEVTYHDLPLPAAEEGAKTQTVENREGEPVQITAPDIESINNQTWYHGGAEGIETLLSSHTSVKSLYGTGVYTTDDESVAESYAKGRSVYPARVTLGTVLDLDSSLPRKALEAIRAALPTEVEERGLDFGHGVIPEGLAGRQIWDALRGAVQDAADEQGWTEGDVVEIFQGIESGLREAGFDAMTHVGGWKAGKGKKPHRVLILLDPAREMGGTDRYGTELYEPLDVRLVDAPAPEAAAPKPKKKPKRWSAPVGKSGVYKGVAWGTHKINDIFPHLEEKGNAYFPSWVSPEGEHQPTGDMFRTQTELFKWLDNNAEDLLQDQPEIGQAVDLEGVLNESESKIIDSLRGVIDRLQQLGQELESEDAFDKNDPRESELARLHRWLHIYMEQVPRAEYLVEAGQRVGDGGANPVPESDQEPPIDLVTSRQVEMAFLFDRPEMITTGLGLDVNDDGPGEFEEELNEHEMGLQIYTSPPVDEKKANDILVDIGKRWGEKVKVLSVDESGVPGMVHIRLADASEHHLWEAEERGEDEPTPDEFGMPKANAPLETGRVTTKVYPGGRGGKPMASWKIIRALMRLARRFGYQGVTDFPLVVGWLKSKDLAGEMYPRELLIKIRDAHDLGAAAHEFGHATMVFIFGYTLKTPITKESVGSGAYRELMAAGRRLYPTPEGQEEKSPKGGFAAEGWAEFIYTYLAEPETLDKLFPNTLEWFDANVLVTNKAARKGIMKVRNMYQRFTDQGSLNYAEEHIADKQSADARWNEFTELMLHGPSGHIVNWWEALQPLWLLDQQAELMTGEPVDFGDSGWQKSQAYRMAHSGIVRYMVQTGMRDFEGVKVDIPPLRDVSDHIHPDNFREFKAYLWAKRARALLTQRDEKGELKPRAAGLTLAQAEEIIEEVEKLRGKSRMEKAAQIVYDWNAGVLDYAAGSSTLFAEFARLIREKDPGYYIPLERQFTEFDQQLAGMGSGHSVDGRGVLKHLKGSDRPIKDPFETMVANAERLVFAAHNRVGLETMFRMSQTIPGMGNLIFREEKKAVPKTSRTMEALVNRIEQEASRQNVDLTITDEFGRPFDQIDNNLAQQVITFYGGAIAPEKGAPIIPFIEVEEEEDYERRVEESGGKDKKRKMKIVWYRVNRRIYRAVMQMDPNVHRTVSQSLVLQYAYDYGVRGANQLFKMGTVGFRASFGLMTNPTRDLQTLWVNTQSNTHAIPMLWTYFVSMIQEMTSALTGGKYKSEYGDLWERLGGEQAMQLMENRNYLRRSARMVSQSRNIGRRIISYTPWRVVGHPIRTVKTFADDMHSVLDFLQDMIQFPERATRITEMKLVAKDIGKDPRIDWKPGEPMTAEISQMLLLAGKQVTVDFTAAGEIARVYNEIVPFFNASLQGARAWRRAMTRDRRTGGLLGWKSAKVGKVNLFPMFRGMQLASLSLFLWWKYKDEEWWKKLDPREKFMFWHFPATINGEDVLVRLPMSYDSGMFFAGTAIALADAAYHQNPDEMTQFMATFAEANAPLEVPMTRTAHGWAFGPTNAAGVLPKLAMELYHNRKSFWDTPVVSPRFLRGPQGESKPRHQMYNEYTSQAARWLGKEYNLMPQQIDHAFQAIVGPISRDILHTSEHLDELFRLKKYETVSDIPVLGRAFRRGGPLGSRPEPIDELYDEAARALVNSHDDDKLETEEEEKRRAKLTDATRAVSHMFNVRTFEKNEKRRRRITRAAMELADKALFEIGYGQLRRGWVRLEAAKWEERERNEEIIRLQAEGKFPQAKKLKADRTKSNIEKMKKLMPSRGRRGPQYDPGRDTIEDYERRMREYMYQQQKARMLP